MSGEGVLVLAAFAFGLVTGFLVVSVTYDAQMDAAARIDGVKVAEELGRTDMQEIAEYIQTNYPDNAVCGDRFPCNTGG